MNNIDRYLIIALFGGYVIKILARGASFSDAAIVLVLAATHFLYTSQIQNKEVSELKQQVATLTDTLVIVQKSQDDIKTNMASVKISQGFRSVK